MRQFVCLWITLAVLLPAAVLAAPVERARSMDIPDDHLSVGGVLVGKYTLEDAMEKFGPAEVYQFGPDGAASFRICYTSTVKENPARVVFEAGPRSLRREITSVKIVSGRVKPDMDVGRCTASARVTEEFGTFSGIRLGMERRALVSMLGIPTEHKKDAVEYEFHARKRLTKEEVKRLSETWPYVRKYPYFDVYSSVSASFHEGRLVRLVISRIETR